MQKRRYRWNVEVFQKQLKNRQILLQNPSIDRRTKKELEDTYLNFKTDFLPLINPQKSIRKEIEQGIILEGIPVDKKIEEYIIHSLPYLVGKESNLIDNDINTSSSFYRCYQSNSQMIDLIIQFYWTMLKIDILPYLIDQDGNSLIQFEYNRNQLLNFSGFTYSNPFDQKNYGIIFRENTIEDMITTAHEISHMLHLKNNPTWFHQNSFYSMEADAIFIEMLLFDFLEQYYNYPRELLDNWRVDYLYNAIDYASIIALHYAIANISDSSFENIEDFLRKQNIMLKLTENDLNYYECSHDLYSKENNYQNNFSYLIALDLYRQYKKNPELAIYYYQLFSTISRKNTEFFLRSLGITFPTDDFQNLKDEVKTYTKKEKK